MAFRQELNFLVLGAVQLMVIRPVTLLVVIPFLAACGTPSSPLSTTVPAAPTTTTTAPFPSGSCPVDVPMAIGVVADPPPEPYEPAMKEPMLVGVLEGPTVRKVIFDGIVTSIEPSPNSEFATWVRVQSGALETIYQTELHPPFVKGDSVVAGTEIGDREGGFFFFRFETLDGSEIDGAELLKAAGCNLSLPAIESFDVTMLDGSKWRVALSAPLVTAVQLQPSGDLLVDGNHVVDVTMGEWKLEADDMSQWGANPQLVETFSRDDGITGEAWTFDTGVEPGYVTWIAAPDGRTVILTSGRRAHDFTGDLVSAIEFTNEAIDVNSDRFVIHDQRVTGSLVDPTALFSGTYVAVVSECEISTATDDCAMPRLELSWITPSQEEAMKGTTIAPAP